MTGQHFAIFETAIGPAASSGASTASRVQLPMGSEEKTRKRILQRNGDVTRRPRRPRCSTRSPAWPNCWPASRTTLPTSSSISTACRVQPRRLRHRAQNPAGQNHTYGEIAKQLGGVELSRDVGQALAATRARSRALPRVLAPATSRRLLRQWRRGDQAEDAADRRRVVNHTPTCSIERWYSAPLPVLTGRDERSSPFEVWERALSARRCKLRHLYPHRIAFRSLHAVRLSPRRGEMKSASGYAVSHTNPLPFR